MTQPKAGKGVPFALGTSFLLIGILLAWLLVEAWPRTVLLVKDKRVGEVIAAKHLCTNEGLTQCREATCTVWLERTRLLGIEVCLTPDARILLLVLLVGALGSYVHATQSFVSYVGARKFTPSWTWWYILRLPVGAALALLFYFVMRGGLLAYTTPKSEAGELNVFGILSFAGLAGLFSKQAADKLSEVFDTLFRTAEDQKRTDKLGDNPKPAIIGVQPSLVPADEGPVALVVAGTGFVAASVIEVTGEPPAVGEAPVKQLPTHYQASDRLTAELDPEDFAGQSKLQVRVYNPPPGGGRSEPFPITLGAAGSP